MTPCSPLKVNRRYWGTWRLHLQGRRIAKQETSRESFTYHLLSRSFLAWLFLGTWEGMRHIPPKHRLTFSGLRGVISRKTELFTTTAVRTSNTSIQFLVSLVTRINSNFRNSVVCGKTVFLSFSLKRLARKWVAKVFISFYDLGNQISLPCSEQLLGHFS
jgi:hypothetical protein